MGNITNNQTGFIYVIKAPDKSFKIGFTTNPLNRLKALAESHHSLTVSAIYCGSMADEKYLHKVFHLKRLSREWFKLSPDDMLFIKKHFEGKDDADRLKEALIYTLNNKNPIRKKNGKVMAKIGYTDIDDVELSDAEIQIISERKDVTLKTYRKIKRILIDYPTLKKMQIVNLSGYGKRTVEGALSVLRSNL